MAIEWLINKSIEYEGTLRLSLSRSAFDNFHSKTCDVYFARIWFFVCSSRFQLHTTRLIEFIKLGEYRYCHKKNTHTHRYEMKWNDTIAWIWEEKKTKWHPLRVPFFFITLLHTQWERWTLSLSFLSPKRMVRKCVQFYCQRTQWN